MPIGQPTMYVTKHREYILKQSSPGYAKPLASEKSQSCPVTSTSADVLNNANQWNGAKPKIRKTKKQPEDSCDIDAREKLVSHRERILKEQERDVQEKSHQTAALKALVTNQSIIV